MSSSSAIQLSASFAAFLPCSFGVFLSFSLFHAFLSALAFLIGSLFLLLNISLFFCSLFFIDTSSFGPENVNRWSIVTGPLFCSHPESHQFIQNIPPSSSLRFSRSLPPHRRLRFCGWRKDSFGFLQALTGVVGSVLFFVITVLNMFDFAGASSVVRLIVILIPAAVTICIFLLSAYFGLLDVTNQEARQVAGFHHYIASDADQTNHLGSTARVLRSDSDSLASASVQDELAETGAQVYLPDSELHADSFCAVLSDSTERSSVSVSISDVAAPSDLLSSFAQSGVTSGTALPPDSDLSLALFPLESDAHEAPPLSAEAEVAMKILSADEDAALSSATSLSLPLSRYAVLPNSHALSLSFQAVHSDSAASQLSASTSTLTSPLLTSPHVVTTDFISFVPESPSVSLSSLSSASDASVAPSLSLDTDSTFPFSETINAVTAQPPPFSPGHVLLPPVSSLSSSLSETSPSLWQQQWIPHLNCPHTLVHLIQYLSLLGTTIFAFAFIIRICLFWISRRISFWIEDLLFVVGSSCFVICNLLQFYEITGHCVACYPACVSFWICVMYLFSSLFFLSASISEFVFESLALNPATSPLLLRWTATFVFVIGSGLLLIGNYATFFKQINHLG